MKNGYPQKRYVQISKLRLESKTKDFNSKVSCNKLFLSVSSTLKLIAGLYKIATWEFIIQIEFVALILV